MSFARARGRVGIRLILGLALLLLVVAATGFAGPSGMVDAPIVDHHQHLMGPAVARIATGSPPLPRAQLPAPLEELLAARARAWNDATALSTLLAKDAIVLSDWRSGWISGAPEAARFLSQRFARPYVLTPVAYHPVGTAALIDGYYTRGDGSATQYLGYFAIVASQASGAWRIASEVPRFPFLQATEARSAAQLIAALDEAGTRKAVVLSEAFWADGPILPVADPYPLVMAENDWTARQVARYPNRLIAFCSFNPVADHALRELERCAANGAFRGLKFSFAMSGVDLTNPRHAERVRTVFAAANRHRLPIVVHLRNGPTYSAEHVRIFLHQIMPAAPDITVQIAHLWGGEDFSQPALDALADAVSRNHPSTRHLIFDLAEVWLPTAPEAQRLIALALRRIGLQRVVFGSDAKTPPRQAWAALRASIPLSDREFEQIARNVAPYLR